MLKMLLYSSYYCWVLERKEATFCHVMYLRGCDTQLWSSMGILSLSIRGQTDLFCLAVLFLPW